MTVLFLSLFMFLRTYGSNVKTWLTSLLLCIFRILTRDCRTLHPYLTSKNVSCLTFKKVTLLTSRYLYLLEDIRDIDIGFHRHLAIRVFSVC